MMTFDVVNYGWVVQSPEDFDGWDIEWVGAHSAELHVLFAKQINPSQRGTREIRLLYVKPEFIPPPRGSVDGFIFIDEAKPRMCKVVKGEVWLHDWNTDHFVQVKAISLIEAYKIPTTMPAERQKYLIDLHAKWEASQEKTNGNIP